MGQSTVSAGQRITASLLNRIYGQADSNSHTVTQTSYTDLSTVYSIPAADAQVGTVYRLTAAGFGVWGSTQQTLAFSPNLAGTNIADNMFVLNTALAASAAFDWSVTITLTCVSTGSSGTWTASYTGIVSESANALLPGTAADNTVPLTGCTHSAVTQDVTVANNFSLRAKWAATTGAPTITAVSTLFEKVN